MANNPIKHFEYNTVVINTRDEFLKEFELKNGRKKNLNFFKFYTQKERLVSIFN